MNRIQLPFISFFLIIFIACNSDDDNYVSIEIQTNPDNVQVNQNTSTLIPVFDNDVNIPSQGSLTVTIAQNGVAIISDPNNTPQNPSDDLITYSPSANFSGNDTFNYTICDNENPQSCKTDTVTITVNSLSNVVFDIDQVPYDTLSEYNFFDGDLKDLIPTFGVIPYEPISGLFTDYAHKKRFIWMPNNTSASYINDHEVLDFPEGTVILKSFYYDNVQPSGDTKIIETRMMIRKSSEWVFANYIWNEDQTEANFDLNESYVNDLEFIENGVTRIINYKIPAESDCFTCHKKAGINAIIAPKPQNLNRDYNFSDGTSNQLQKLVDIGYLDNKPATINTVVKWDDPSQPLDLRVRSYLDINCAHCHSDLRHCDYRPLRLAFDESDNDTNLGICVVPDEEFAPYSRIIQPGNIARSMMHFRLSTNQEQYRMPLLGRTIVHEEAVELIEEWINSLTTVCQ